MRWTSAGHSHCGAGRYRVAGCIGAVDAKLAAHPAEEPLVGILPRSEAITRLGAGCDGHRISECGDLRSIVALGVDVNGPECIDVEGDPTDADVAAARFPRR